MKQTYGEDREIESSADQLGGVRDKNRAATRFKDVYTWWLTSRIVCTSASSQTRPTVSALGSSPANQRRQKGLLRVCSAALSDPSRASIITSAPRITTEVAIRGRLRVSVTRSSRARRQQIFWP